MHLRAGRRALLLLVGILGTVIAPTALPASAQDGSGWGIAPSGSGNAGERDFFVYQLKPGQGFQDVVGISNLTEEPLTFTIIARDAYNTPGDGGYALQDTDAVPVDAGSWIELPVDTYTVEPHSRADIPFNIVVPPDATPGDHAGGIIATLAPGDDPNAGDVDVLVERRIAARVYVRVAGPLQPAVAIEQLDLDYSTSFSSLLTGETATVSYTVRNVGNVRMTPTARLTLQDPLGRTIATVLPRQLPELLPGSTATATATIHDVRPPFRLTARLAVEAAGEATSSATRSTSVWAIPWLGVVMLVVVAGVIWRARRRRRQRRQPPQPPSPRAHAREPVGV